MTLFWFHIPAFISLIIWSVLIFARGAFWRADQRLPSSAMPDECHSDSGQERAPDIAVVIPARNEAETIGRTVSSLLAQEYSGAVHIIVVDDESSDGTGENVQRIANNSDRVTIIDGMPLNSGWTGKLWAVHQGLQHIDRAIPTARYVLLTDADIDHDCHSVQRLVCQAEQGRYDLVSLMVLLNCRYFWERLLIPAFVFFFQKLFPFAWVNDPKCETAAAAGGCMLVRRSALENIGGVETIRNRLIDDCALAEALKKKGPIWLGLTESVVSSREYGSLDEIWRMVSRSAFEQLDHSSLRLLGTVFGMVIIYLVPPISCAAGGVFSDPVLFITGFLAWGGMVWAYRPTLTLYKRSWLWGLLLPVIGGLYTLMTFTSAYQYWRGRGGGWKSRYYSPAGS